MYSRKSVRSYQPMTRYLPSGAEDTEREVTPPPDYMGIAFSTGRERANFPEAVISEASIPMEQETAEDAIGNREEAPLYFSDAPLPTASSESHRADEDARTAFSGEEPYPSEELLSRDAAHPGEESLPLSPRQADAPISPGTPALSHTPVLSSSPAIPNQSDSPDGTVPPILPNGTVDTTDATDANADTPNTPEMPESDSAEPLFTPAWLRSLTLEDMLLFWLILLLLSGEPEDQIYLLLGLLLFAGR